MPENPIVHRRGPNTRNQDFMQIIRLRFLLWGFLAGQLSMVSTTLWFIPNIPRDCKITEKTNLLFLPGGRTRIKVSHHHWRGPRRRQLSVGLVWQGREMPRGLCPTHMFGQMWQRRVVKCKMHALTENIHWQGDSGPETWRGTRDTGGSWEILNQVLVALAIAPSS